MEIKHLAGTTAGKTQEHGTFVLHAETPEQAEAMRGILERAAPEAGQLNANTNMATQSQADAWQEVCRALDEVSPDWWESAGTGVDLAVAAIKNLGACAAGLPAAGAAIKTLEALGYTYHGGEQWKPPLGKHRNEVHTEHGVVALYGNPDALRLVAERLLPPTEPAQPAPEPQPFDLEAAKRGEPLVTRDGRKAVFVGHDAGAHEHFRVLARIGDELCATAIRENGRVANYNSPGDLFMAPKPKRTRTVWVNVYDIAHDKRDALESCAWNNENDAAEDSHINTARVLKTVPVEIDA